MFSSAFDPTRPGRATLYGMPAGHDVRVLAEIAGKTHGAPLIHVALDDVRAAIMADAFAFFAPQCEIVQFPAWDCLPYDRISPHPDIAGARLAALTRFGKPFKRPCVVLTTVNAAVQKTLPPEILGEASLAAAIGDELPIEKLRAFLAANGYAAASAVREPGEFAVRGGIVDIYPSGHDAPLRIDFFGDEIEAIRVFDPLTQTTTDKINEFRLGPVTEALLDERSIAKFRAGYRELFGAVNDKDPLYESVSAGRKFPGLEHWLGLLYPRLCSLFDYLPAAPVAFDPQAEESIASRFAQIEDFYRARLSLYEASRRNKPRKDNGERSANTLAAVYKPAPVASLYLDKKAVDDIKSGRATCWLSPFANSATESPALEESEKSVTTAQPDSLPLAGRARVGELQQAGNRNQKAESCSSLSPTTNNHSLASGSPTLTLPARGRESDRANFKDDASGHTLSIDAQGRRGRDFADARAQSAANPAALYDALRAYAAERQSRNQHVAIACASQGSAERLANLLRNHNLTALTVLKDFDSLRKTDRAALSLIVLGLEHGFVAPDLALVTEQDLLGDRLVRPTQKRRASAKFQLELGSLNTGDFVVHAEHGIGRYEGLETLTVMGLQHDCVKLIYDGGDKLYVPVENLEVLTRYGAADSGASLDKLGGAGWQQRKARVKNRLKDMADELMKIAAAREVRKGEIVGVEESAWQEFAARFPYPETEDQARAIEQVREDLLSGKPMDRLVCGDVGFGKTEVALRSAFAAVQAGLQVAVVVPTTLLARQHYNNFVRRFAGFPVRIAQLSRMVTAQEAKQTKEELKAGRVEIVVGTHALLGKEVGFQNLGLLIIDEEQHFGVKQKEKLKELRAEVHVLTLTATPIPRTLQLAMSGVRELSLIATPPLDRLAVRTFVLPYDPIALRDALMREHFRGGQSFYVCPRIEDLAGVEEALRELVPEAKLVTAHGRMTPTQLDDIMTAFDAKQYDILLATNIVESGLDIPNANTIVIHRADMFGLAQLYQLRGRVGRAKLRGYAYLTYPAEAPLSKTALQRLEVIQTLEELGAGFQLASHDMDIRGAGNLLGEEQSGHVREVGIELYQQMLQDAVAIARAGGDLRNGGQERWTPQINLGLSVLIPEDYVRDLNLRLGLYRRLADIETEADIEALAVEMIDRFGPLPPEVENLTQIVKIKLLCRKAGVEKIDAGPKGAVIAFRDNKFANPDKLIAWIAKQSGTVKVRPDQKLVLLRLWDTDAQRLNGARKTLEELAGMEA
ncbi:MAG: transcription-repair coupling factor [Bdellovibrionales bacterium]